MQHEGLDSIQSEESHCRCIVCEKFTAVFFVSVDGYRYLHCRVCMAVYLDPAQRLSANEEYARYCQHQNTLYDPEYRHFLSKLSVPLLKKVPPGSKGLDFGCGPGPALALMLREAGHRMRLFDVFFYPDPTPLDDLYDFITCTETIEHLHHPAETFARFDKMLRPGGWLAVMTCFLLDDSRFLSWHYRRDPTHVVFYRAATLRYIAGQFGWNCEIPTKDVALMQKPQ
ncbi:MAG: class I SAM-dependent methyltransferase [Desulfobulbaceae bacterium]